jgi:hypothetical protein
MTEPAPDLAQDLAETFSEVLNHLIPMVEAADLDRAELLVLRELLTKVGTLFIEYEEERKAGRATGTLMDDNGWLQFQELQQQLEVELNGSAQHGWQDLKLRSQALVCLKAWGIVMP